VPPRTPVRKKREGGIDVGYVTVTYRSVFLTIFALLFLTGAILYFAFPKQTTDLASSIGSRVGAWFDKTMGKPSEGKGKKPAGQQKATFTMLEGTVKVKKKDSNTWATASYDLQLEKGDVVQTSSEGMAKIVFADLTNYTVKPDSLIVVEDNSTTADDKTNVAVQVTTGTVDLATGTFTQGSRSQVIVAGTTAEFGAESQAKVVSDPRAGNNEILVTKGKGEINQGGQLISLASYEKVSFNPAQGKLVKSKEVAPPILIDPANMLPVFATGEKTNVKFSWTPVEGSRGYHVRIARNPYFTQMLKDIKVATTDLVVPDIVEGAYYWSVQSLDPTGRESLESERNRFTVIRRSTGAEVPLTLDDFIQHGRVIEVRGKTDPTARVMVNGGEVPALNADGTFRYYTPPLPNGENLITVTAQTARGGVNTLTKKVVIQ
jgi:hypothetical protein